MHINEVLERDRSKLLDAVQAHEDLLDVVRLIQKHAATGTYRDSRERCGLINVLAIQAIQKAETKN